MSVPVLSVLIWMPILTGILVFFLKKDSQKAFARFVSIVVSTSLLALCLFLINAIDPQRTDFQWSEKISWIPSLDIHYALGVDALSLSLIALTCLMTWLVIVLACRPKNQLLHPEDQASNHYLAAFLIMQGLVCGTFAALDAIVFYVFWEAALIPMFFIIGLWGSSRKRYATMKFILYTLFGSVFLLTAILYLGHLQQHLEIGNLTRFEIAAFQGVPLGLRTQQCLFFAFLLAFGIKLPLWPLHSWLPDAHSEAPTGGSILLAAILLKMGAYGLLRFLLPIVPDASRFFAVGMVCLSLLAIVSIALIAIAQMDLKKLVAYSSIAHMGFVTLGLFGTYLIPIGHTQSLGVLGAFIQLISHGFISAALFLCIGLLYERAHSRLIQDYGGIAQVMPRFTTYFMFFILANLGLPGTSGFVSEFLIILSSFQSLPIIALIASCSLVLTAFYSLRMYQQVALGPIFNPAIVTFKDLSAREWGLCLILALPILILGLYPKPLMDFMTSSIQPLLLHMLSSKI